jgi:hypothetical protein
MTLSRHTASRVVAIASLLASTHVVPLRSAPFSSIEAPLPNGECELRTASVSLADAASAKPPSAEQPPGGLGRTYWKLGESQLHSLPPLPKVINSQSLLAGESGFDIWDAAQSLRASAGSAFLVSFFVTSSLRTKIILGIGCNDEILVGERDRIIFASVGRREFIRAQNLIPLELEPGKNLVTILCRKPASWSEIPAMHGSNQWLLSVDLFASPLIAWRMFRSRNFHIIDTPIVDNLDDIMIESILPMEQDVALYDINGNQLCRAVAVR